MRSRSKNPVMLVFAIAAFASIGWAQGQYPSGQGGNMAPEASVPPAGLKNVGIEQRLNEQVPADLVFRDETGKAVKLGDYFGKKPLILSLMYFRCPMLCGEVLSGMEGAMKALPFDAGKEFDVLTVSFDPKDTPQSATEKKAEMLRHYKRATAAGGWHFLTGSQESIDALTKAVGFGYSYDEKTQQYAHATAIMILTPQGKISQYYYGVEYPPRDLRLGIEQASQSHIGTLADQVLLYCFHYDPTVGKYNAVISRVLKLSGGLTILCIGAVVLVLLRRGSDAEIRDQSRAH